MIGEFDGFHLGHRRLVEAGLAAATRLGCPVHGVVVDRIDRTRELMPAAVRCRRLLRSGLRHVRVCRAVDVTDHSGAERVAAFVAEAVGPGIAVIGCRPDDHDARSLPFRAALERSDLDVIEVPRLCTNGVEVTSERIVDLLTVGAVELTQQNLGRPFAISGVVAPGDQRGRTIGFPTANLHPGPRQVVPHTGVYAGWGVQAGRRWPAAINVGTRPTFYSTGDEVIVEAHLIGFEGDLYGRELDLEFHRRIREEKQFESKEALVAQLRRDVTEARELARSS